MLEREKVRPLKPSVVIADFGNEATSRSEEGLAQDGVCGSCTSLHRYLLRSLLRLEEDVPCYVEVDAVIERLVLRAALSKAVIIIPGLAGLPDRKLTRLTRNGSAPE